MRTGPCFSQYFGRRRREFRCRGMPSPGNREASAAAWGSFRTASATLMLCSESPPGTVCAATGWASSSRGVPMAHRTMPDDRPLKRPAPLWRRVAQAAGRTAFCLSLSMRLGLPRCRLTLRTAELPVGPRRAAAGSLARSCRAERPATEHGTSSSQFPLAAVSRSPKRVPTATDALSAMESLRLGPLAVHDDVSEEICTVPLSLADRVHTTGSVFSSWHCGIPRKVKADAGAVMARFLPQ
ncbi:hypothetical protein TcBrA4_0082920 [Trypanosoma cruzi]|nr:hypothetical protein TcBrA4_0082920 [Trypanosoma cruzi]